MPTLPLSWIRQNSLLSQCDKHFLTNWVIPLRLCKLWWIEYPVDTGCKLNVHKTFRKRPGCLLNVLYTFNLRPVSTGYALSACRIRDELSKPYQALQSMTNCVTSLHLCNLRPIEQPLSGCWICDVLIKPSLEKKTTSYPHL